MPGSGASAVNDLGQVAGHSTTAGGQIHAALWSPTPTALTVTGARGPRLIHQSLTLTATLSTASGRPAGTVRFYDGAVLLGSSPLVRDRATLTTSSLTLGHHTITATYSGDATFLASTSSALGLVVTYKIRSRPGTSGAGVRSVNFQLLDARNVNLSSPAVTVDGQCIAPYPSRTCAQAFENLGDVPLPYLSARQEYSLALPGGLGRRTRYDLIIAVQNDPLLHAVTFSS